MIQKENKWVEEQIAIQCAPLVAGLKPSNLLILPKNKEQILKDLLRKTKFASYLLAEYDEKQVYLLYRVNELVVYLTEPPVQELLAELGYEGGELYSLLNRVSDKFAAYKKGGAPFPHELGLLLGYPAVDVRGFMVHKGKKFLYSGYWKVYGNPGETLQLFAEFGRAKIYIGELMNRGYDIADICAMYHSAKAFA